MSDGVHDFLLIDAMVVRLLILMKNVALSNKIIRW